MVSPCRLEHDSGDLEALKPFDQGAMAFRGVGDAEAPALGVDRDVERAFRNVDADISCYGCCHLFSVLVLSRGLDPRVSVQAAGKREGWSNYKSVLSGLARSRPIPSRRRPDCDSSRRRPILPDQTTQIIRQDAVADRAAALSSAATSGGVEPNAIRSAQTGWRRTGSRPARLTDIDALA